MVGKAMIYFFDEVGSMRFFCAPQRHHFNLDGSDSPPLAAGLFIERFAVFSYELLCQFVFFVNFFVFFLKEKRSKAMSKVVKVYVVDDAGNGVSMQTVSTYNTDTVHKTDENGLATVIFEGSEDTLYVNGFKAFSGYVSKLDSPSSFTRVGKAF
jgi:hypothetical protein